MRLIEMAQLYANENFPRPVAEELRRLGHTVLTSQESGMADRAVPDHEVLEFAKSGGFALLTINWRHFFKSPRHKSKSRWNYCLHIRPAIRPAGRGYRCGHRQCR